MDLDGLVAIAFDRTPTQGEVDELATSEGQPVEEVMDRFARCVAERYLDGLYSFADADTAMNNLFAWATALTGRGLPEFAWQVFGAFDAGEFLRPGAPKEQQGEALTRTLLSRCLRTDLVVCPPLIEATRQLQEFLLSNGWPTAIVWVASDERSEPLSPVEVSREYEFARHRGLGLCLRAIRVRAGATFVAIEYPGDSDQAERLMYRSDGGLKLSMPLRREDD